MEPTKWRITSPGPGSRADGCFSPQLLSWNDEGRIKGAIETLQDVTDRKTRNRPLVNRKRRLRALLDFEPYPIVVFTLDGCVSYLNPAFTEIFGWTLAELEGKRISYVPPGLEEETRESIRRLNREKVIMHYEKLRG